MNTTGLPAPQSVNASFTPVAASMKSPAPGMARAGAGCAPMASSAAASKPALSVVERVDFRRVRRSIVVIPDLVRNLTAITAIMTRGASRDDYVRGKIGGVGMWSRAGTRGCGHHASASDTPERHNAALAEYNR